MSREPDETDAHAERLRREVERWRSGLRKIVEEASADALKALETGDAARAAEAMARAGDALRRSAIVISSVTRSASLLTSEHGADTVNTMDAISTDALRSRSALSEDALKHAFVRAFTDKGEKIADIAKWLEEKLKRRVPRSTVQSWYKDPSDPAYRPIPEDAEELIRARYRIPRSSWHRIQAKRR